ncbi:tail protein (tape measure) [Salmonella enterica subsp. enterica serovar Oranienburg]|uniref:Tail protein (Tape measure) n=1 Tax=Salmonella enterica TaxID=28901 RepID=A0A750T5F5_SALER|nr:tail protein (tape measure) [Salmonella enterica]EAA6003062.1 tail protein (tape measure) [Salmonella enterica subsp. enterica serovar Oranienburg]EBV8515845.1 tail protein (tape measure) [Salmonella enterica subsp. enterica serovar Mbandaka]ECA2118480.1 tail protein (tape measure) [Salmonella enterica subsp. enterica serovar Virchow]ECC3197315.1 tail protein (tape measure) [Salmonella enterica subsp. enterica]ECN1451909.1 tail protein (tape measure) [Salmonella enterica subsp. enterica ser
MDAGSVVYIIKAETDQLLKANKQVDKFLSQLQSSFDGADKAADNLGGTLKQAGSAIDDTSSAAGDMAKNVAAVEGAVGKLNTNINSLTRAILESRSGVSGASSEFSRAESIIESLGNQLAILEEQQEGSARSAAILAAQLRAGSNATEAEKKTIADLTGRLYDMKNGTEAGAKGTKNWKSTMQQAGYQVQDFIVQVQGGQSALVAFGQQGSQLAGAFGPGGAVLGAVIALSSVIGGVLISSLKDGKNATDALSEAVATMDKVITISQNGVAVLTDKYAALAKINASVATLMKKQAELELQSALSKVSKEVQSASNNFITFGNSLVSSLGNGYASVKLFDSYLSTLNITTNNFSDALKQAAASGQTGQTAMNSMIATVGALASKFDISDQQAYEFAKQLSDISKTPSEDKLNSLVKKVQEFGVGASKGAQNAREYAKKLLQIVTSSAEATRGLKELKEMTDSLLSSQDRALQLAKQELFIAKQTGDEKLKAQAWRDAETQGLKAGTQAFRDYYNVRLQTYQQQQANLKSAKDERNEQSAAVSAAKKAETQAERNARVLNEYRQKAELSADSTSELSREQAILAARQKLANPTQQQIAQVEKDAAAAWDKAAALKAQNAVPELKEKANYNAQRKALDSLKDQRDANGNLILSQQQYYKASEQLEQQHQVNLAKIRAEQASVNPIAEARGQVDPVQQLANENTQKLKLMQQYQQQEQAVLSQSYKNGQMSYAEYIAAKQTTDAQYLALRTAQETQYEQQRIEAQWEIFRNQCQANELLAASLDGLQNSTSSALTGLINGTQSLQESFANIGSTILNSVVSAIVDMGVQYVKSLIVGKAMSSAATAAQIAEAGALATAWAPAAMAASIATQGKASAIGLAAYSSSMAAGQALSIAGARYNGGPVAASSMYRVGEHGKPEIFQASNGSQYMIPGDNGRVISNRDMQGGGNGGVVQHITFEINTTGGISDADWARIEANGVKISKKMALFHIHDEANRPGGIIQKRK